MAELAAQKYFDLFFLDVEMEDQANGIELTHKIRCRYQEPMIVYVTNHLECAPKAFEVNAYRFIPKRMLADKLSDVLDHALAVIDQIDQCAYVVDTPDCVERILKSCLLHCSAFFSVSLWQVWHSRNRHI